MSIWKKSYDKFAITFKQKLNLLILEQSWRKNMYHETVDEWFIKHTSLKMKQKYQIKIQTIVKLWNNILNDDNNNENNDNDVNVRISLKKVMTTSYQANWFSTSSLSVESFWVTSYKKKRWKIFEKDDAKTKCSVKTRVNND